MYKAAVVLGVLLGVLLVSGCATQGAYIEPEQLEQIKAEITTAQELEAALGIPSVTIPRDDGKVMWVYEGIHVRGDPTYYVPYVSLLVGTLKKNCTRLSVLVNREDGSLSQWEYATAEDRDYWMKTNNRCGGETG